MISKLIGLALERTNGNANLEEQYLCLLMDDHKILEDTACKTKESIEIGVLTGRFQKARPPLPDGRDGLARSFVHVASCCSVKL